jgi:CHASE2 domain-containing sensor protein
MIRAPSPGEAGARAVSWHPAALCLASLLGIVGLFFVPAVAPALLSLEHWTADWRTALLSDRRATTHPDIAIVAITSATLEPYPFILPVDRGLQADIVEAVVRAGARAVALDFYFTKGTIKETDDRFQRALASVQDKLILGAYENLKPAQLAYQYDFLGRLRAPVGYLNLNRDRDDTVRSRAPPPAQSRYQESFSAQLAHAAGRKQPDTPERIAWLLPPTDGSATFLRIEAHRLLDPSTGEAARLKNRVVIIAGDFPYFDRHRTPLSLSTGTEMTGAEIHAQMAAELIDGNRSYSLLTPSQARIFLAGLAALAVALGWRFQARRFDLLDWRVASFALVVADALVFKFAHLILPFTLAAFAWVLGITLGTQSRGAATWLAYRLGRRS